MSYLDKILQPGETVRYVAKLHWVLYAPGLLAWILAAALALLWPADRGFRAAIEIVAWLLVAIGLLLIARAWFEQWTTEIAVTDRRVIYKRGFIRRFTVEMNMNKVESVDVDQSILGRILGYGTVSVRGTGTGFEPLPNIAEPLELRNHITAE